MVGALLTFALGLAMAAPALCEAVSYPGPRWRGS